VDESQNEEIFWAKASVPMSEMEMMTFWDPFSLILELRDSSSFFENFIGFITKLMEYKKKEEQIIYYKMLFDIHNHKME
jgi:hypothetical protein